MADIPQQNICRLCGLNGVMISIFEPKHEQYLKKIADFLHITIDINDSLPKVLCHRCVIKIDDFQEFYSGSHSTQEQLRKIYGFKERIVNDAWSNRQNIPTVNINGVNSDYVQFFNSASEPPPIADLNPPTTIQFNLLTCSNSNETRTLNTGVENNSGNNVPRNDIAPVNFNSQIGRTYPAAPGRSFMSRGGSRPFPKKPGQNPPTSSAGPETIRRRSSSDVEVLPESTKISSAEDTRAREKQQESSASEEKKSETRKSSSVASAPPKKKKKYLSPFERPRRKRGRNRKKPSEEQSPASKRPNKMMSSTDEDTSANEISSIPEKDLEKYFILTNVPGVGTIYTCKKCETILMSMKAACSHTKCLNRGGSSSEDEQGENSSSSESSDVEPSDTSKSDTTEKESIYQCSYCDKPFTRNVVRLQHEQIHLREMSISDEEEDVYVEPKKPKISKKKDYDSSLIKGFFR